MTTSVQKIPTRTGMALVVANMIGAGAFTSLGFQLKDLHHAPLVLTLWVLGGVLALSGAFSYAEVGGHIKRSGGEYAFLSDLFHPAIGYLAGWVSITVGFAAPVALAAMAVVEYFPYASPDPKWASIVLVALITWVHSRNLRTSSRFQDISTLLKVLLIAVLIAVGLLLDGNSGNAMTVDEGFLPGLFSPAFAIALIYVSYSYSGWNAAAYITEEFQRPDRSLPLALIGGTLIVTVLYTLMQYVFLKHVPIAELRGQLNVGTMAAHRMLGIDIGNTFGLAISLLLISGISAMVWVGPRVTASMAGEHPLWHRFRAGANGIPQRALWLQFTISALLLLTGTFEQILVYCGILLAISAMITVIGVFKLRRRPGYMQTEGYKSPLFPLFQVLFVILSLWMIVYAFTNSTFETVAGMGNLLVGWLTYRWSSKTGQEPPSDNQPT